MDTREKLIELLSQVQYLGGLEEKVADHLIANGITVQEWISVKDRLPEPFETVLVFEQTQAVSTAYMTQHKEWGGIYIKSYVTHWMPLPQPPKGE